MSNTPDKNSKTGMWRYFCDICNEDYYPGGYDMYDFPNGKNICETCWLEVYNSKLIDWGADRKKRIRVDFDYVRINIPYKIREEVFNRDNRKCKICSSKSNLCLDHIFPQSKGGSNDVTNLQTLCSECNSKKYTKYG